MAEENLNRGRRIGTVKAAINMYGQKATPQTSPSVVEDLHKSGKELGIYKDSTIASESLKAKAEAELYEAKKTVKELTLLIRESNLRLKYRNFDNEAVKKVKIDGKGDGYERIMSELENVKQELSKLKLDVAYVSKEKVVAEKEVTELRIRMLENSKLLESLKLDVDVANEEHVLVELAKIEALRERKEVEEQRDREREEVIESLETKKKRISVMAKEIERSKEIKNVLSETLLDIEMLETQLKLVKDMERRVQRDDSMSRSRNRSNFERGKDNLSVLKQVTEETEAKKEKLASINSEVLYLVGIMDSLRQELEQTKQERVRVDKMLLKDDVMIERLNMKLLMAKDKLEAVSEAEERITSLADNLTCSFEKLNNDKETAKKEEFSLKEEAMLIKNRVHETEIGLCGKEKELLLKLDELEKAKKTEALALKKLETVVEKTMEARETDSRRNDTITISRFEYDYLSGQASQAEETAEKKVEAAMAWVEALKASTKAISIKTETLKRESGKTMKEEERESFRMQRSLSIKRLVQNEIEKFKENNSEEDNNDKGSLMISPKPVRKSIRLSGKFNTVQGGKSARRYSSGNRGTPSYFVIKKKKKIPNLVRFFSRKRDKVSLEQQY
ncbi:unnamed protein product [Cochlearia groenlandica]